MKNATKQKYLKFFNALKDSAGENEKFSRELVKKFGVNYRSIHALRKSGIIKFDPQSGAMSWRSETPIENNVDHLYGIIVHYCAPNRPLLPDGNLPERGISITNDKAPTSGALSAVPPEILFWIKAHAQGPSIKVEHETIVAALKLSYPQAFDKSVDLSGVKNSGLGVALADGGRVYVGVIRRGDMLYTNKAFSLNARFNWRIEEQGGVVYLIPEEKQ